MSKQSDYTIQTVTVISQGEQVAFVLTRAGGFLVGSIPDAFNDAHDAGIIAKAQSLDEAKAKFEKMYGIK